MTDPFVVTQGRLGDRELPAAAAPLIRTEAPTGGPVWVVTDDALARQVLADPRVTKDPAFAPAHWRTWELGLEPPGEVRPSLTTVDGEPHLRLRRAHAPLFTARRLREHADRIAEIARELLTEASAEPVDLAADFTARFPLTVVCELLGVPASHLDDIAAVCRSLMTGVVADITAGTGILNRLVGAALREGNTAAAELRARLPKDITDEQAQYLLSGLVIAGQVTTEGALGFLVAHLLAGHAGQDDDAFVQDILRRYPPAPFTLWRFTTAEIELAGAVLPPRSPVLINIERINANGHDLTFGAGAHFCIGAQLAQLELTAVVQVLRSDFPRARLAIPFRGPAAAEPRHARLSPQSGSGVSQLKRGKGSTARGIAVEPFLARER